jgi:NAD dependent epimerase/dehydratase family
VDAQHQARRGNPAAAWVGCTHANVSRPADFLDDDNLTVRTNVIHAAAEIGMRKLLFLGCPASIRGSRGGRSTNPRR